VSEVRILPRALHIRWPGAPRISDRSYLPSTRIAALHVCLSLEVIGDGSLADANDTVGPGTPLELALENESIDVLGLNPESSRNLDRQELFVACHLRSA
jgi:hypothetical protein